MATFRAFGSQSILDPAFSDPVSGGFDIIEISATPTELVIRQPDTGFTTTLVGTGFPTVPGAPFSGVISSIVIRDGAGAIMADLTGVSWAFADFAEAIQTLYDTDDAAPFAALLSQQPMVFDFSGRTAPYWIGSDIGALITSQVTWIGSDFGDRFYTGAGNDTVQTGPSVYLGAGEQIFASLGTDTYDFSGMTPRGLSASPQNSWIDLTYVGVTSGPITANLNGITNVGTVTGTGLSHTLVNVRGAMNDADGLTISGTALGDSFTVTPDENNWYMGIAGEDGADSYTLTLNGTVRLIFRGYYVGPAPQGVVIDLGLASGQIINDGFGNTETVTLIDGNGEFQIEGTDLADDITGGTRDETFLPRGGNDSIDGGGGFDRIRYDRSGVNGPVTVDLLTGVATGVFGATPFTHSLSNIEAVRFGRSDGAANIVRGDDLANRLEGWNATGHSTIDGRGGDDTLFGGWGNDTATGGAGLDLIHGESGADSLMGEGSSDTIYGGEGNDTLDGGTSADLLHGDAGDDRIDGGSSSDTIYGGDGADEIYGGSSADLIQGDIGNDTVYGGTSNDTVYGGANNDLIFGDDGNDSLLGDGSSDTIWGGLGDDTIDGGTSADTVYGEAGADSILGGSSADLIYGGTENDTILGGTSNDTVYGGSHSDLIQGEDGNDSLFGDGSVDTVRGGLGDDVIDGGSSADELHGDAGRDSILGGSSGDLIYGGTENDTIRGGTSNDTVYGGSHSDRLYGDSGNDQLYGEGSADTIYGGTGNDLIDGGSSADKLYGGSNADTLIGGSNNDTLYGGSSSDTLTGGTGDDVFVFNTGIGASVDTITDFTVADDTIWLEDAVFAGLAPGALDAAAFAIGPATTADQRVLYDAATGALSFDADGNGAGAAVQFAILTPGLALTAADFLVV